MRICVFTRSYDQTVGGMEKHTQDLCRGLVKRGHCVVVLTTGKTAGGGIIELKSIGESEPTVYYLGPYSKGKLNKGYFIESLKQFNMLQEMDGPFDVVHSQGTAAWYYLQHRDDDTPVVNTPHGTHLNEIRSILQQKPSLKNLGRVAYYLYHYIGRGRGIMQKSDAVIAISDELYVLIPKEYGIPHEKVFGVYNGIDIDLFSPRKVEKLPYKSILYVGQLVEQKGVQNLISALPEVRTKHDARLVIVGEGQFRGKLEELVGLHELSQHVVFVGSVGRNELPEYYSKCEVCVFPTTRQEGMPLAVIEAMSCEAPVIASKIGGIKSIISPGLTGILVPPKDTKMILSAILEVLDNPILAREMAKNARKRCIDFFSLEQMISNTISVYVAAMNGRTKK